MGGGSVSLRREGSRVIVIVGAGLIGLGIAYELAKRGATVRVLDAGEPAGAASWAGAGMLAPHTETHASEAFEAFCAASLARYPAFVSELRGHSGVDAQLHLDGILEAAYDPSNVLRLQEHVERLCIRGIGARWLTSSEAHLLEPGLGATLRGAALTEGEGHVDNRRLGRALRAACEVLGVRVESQVGSVALEADARRALGVRVPDGFVAADTVINATGAWAAGLEGVPEMARVPVVPVKGQMLALAVPRNFVRRVVWVPGAYLVPREDGRLLVGATVERSGFDVRFTAAAARSLLEAALEAMPALADFALAETWAGLRPGTPDGLPFIGATALGGYVVASGHYRNGILLTPATAVAVADLLEGRASGELSLFSPQRAQEAVVPLAK